MLKETELTFGQIFFLESLFKFLLATKRWENGHQRVVDCQENLVDHCVALSLMAIDLFEKYPELTKFFNLSLLLTLIWLHDDGEAGAREERAVSSDNHGKWDKPLVELAGFWNLLPFFDQTELGLLRGQMLQAIVDMFTACEITDNLSEFSRYPSCQCYANEAVLVRFLDVVQGITTAFYVLYSRKGANETEVEFAAKVATNLRSQSVPRFLRAAENLFLITENAGQAVETNVEALIWEYLKELFFGGRYPLSYGKFFLEVLTTNPEFRSIRKRLDGKIDELSARVVPPNGGINSMADAPKCWNW